mmetsp:Transcript_14016/g.35309  ORF Transcript_14016/g.35309 Transcript_14016/m.35309 type:complete len:527 (-) Transcript_14016:1004-2584(-)
MFVPCRLITSPATNASALVSPVKTWYFKISPKSARSRTPARLSSPRGDTAASKAALLGAKTVYLSVPSRVSFNPAFVKASIKCEKPACVPAATMVPAGVSSPPPSGISSTPPILCTTPLPARMSALAMAWPFTVRVAPAPAIVTILPSTRVSFSPAASAVDVMEPDKKVVQDVLQIGVVQQRGGICDAVVRSEEGSERIVSGREDGVDRASLIHVAEEVIELGFLQGRHQGAQFCVSFHDVKQRVGQHDRAHDMDDTVGGHDVGLRNLRAIHHRLFTGCGHLDGGPLHRRERAGNSCRLRLRSEHVVQQDLREISTLQQTGHVVFPEGRGSRHKRGVRGSEDSELLIRGFQGCRQIRLGQRSDQMGKLVGSVRCGLHNVLRRGGPGGDLQHSPNDVDHPIPRLHVRGRGRDGHTIDGQIIASFNKIQGGAFYGSRCRCRGISQHHFTRHHMVLQQRSQSIFICLQLVHGLADLREVRVESCVGGGEDSEGPRSGEGGRQVGRNHRLNQPGEIAASLGNFHDVGHQH